MTAGLAHRTTDGRAADSKLLVGDRRAGQFRFRQLTHKRQREKMSSSVLLFLTFLALASGAPTMPDLDLNRHHETLQAAIEDVGKSTVEVMKSKAAVVQFLAETSANAAVEGTKTTYRYVNFNYVKF